MMNTSVAGLYREIPQTQEQTNPQYTENLKIFQEENDQVKKFECEFFVAILQQNRVWMDRIVSNVTNILSTMEVTVQKMKSVMEGWEATRREQNIHSLDTSLQEWRAFLDKMHGVHRDSIELSCRRLIESIVSSIGESPVDHHLFRSLENLEQEASYLLTHVKEKIVQDARLRIAKACAVQGAEGIEQHFHLFGLQNELVRIELAKLCAEHHPQLMPLFIRNFQIENEEARYEIAEICVKKAPRVLAEYLPNFELSEEKRTFLARVCVGVFPPALAENIRTFNITNEQVLTELAERCTQYDVFMLAQNIQNFRIASEEARFELAKVCAQKNIQALVLDFQNFGITSEALQEKLFEFCLQLGEAHMLERIQQFSIR